MFKNYLTIAIRAFRRGKTFSILNLTGLAVGMASATLILLWIWNESSYDSFHEHGDRIYGCWNRTVINGEMQAWDNTPKILGPTLRKDYAGVENICRLDNRWFVTDAGDKKMSSHALVADSTFLELFSFPLLRGDRATVLQHPHSIVVTEAMAKKLWGDQDPMGKSVKINKQVFSVTGVLKNLPPNTSMDFEFVLPWDIEKVVSGDDDLWGNNSIQTWVMLKPGVTQASMEAQIRNITIQHTHGAEKTEVFLHPLALSHLYTEGDNGRLTGGLITTVRLFGIIAAFILLIACINFMNLSTARSEKRAKEVGIRKVAGAYRWTLISQFLSESILMALLSGLFAMVLVSISLPAFDKLVGKELAMPYGNVWFWLMALAFVVLTGVLAGSYPALYLSGFRPVAVLKGAFKKSHARVNPRKVLVVLQFTFAILLIICTLIVVRQIRHGQEREAGYDRGQIVYQWSTGDINDKYDIIKRALLRTGVVAGVTRTGSPLTMIFSDSWGFKWAGKAADDKTDFDRFSEDEGLIKTAGIQLVQGRDMDLAQFPTDSTAMLLNESAVKAMGFKDPIGQLVQDYDNTYHVVGVIKDFSIRSPYDQVHPMVVEGVKSRFFNVVNIRLVPGHTNAASLEKIGRVFATYNPEYPFEYHFANDDFGLKFVGTQRIATLTGLFAGLTIFISCLGLFGLAAYMSESRLKEIGVRKVLGASVLSITGLLTREFLVLVGLSILIASPLAWYIMDGWLQGFSYRVTIGVWVFVLAGGGSILIAILTVGGQAMAAARVKPMKNLRSE